MKTFIDNGTEYTASTCTAIAVSAGDSKFDEANRQPALYIVSFSAAGERFEDVVYNWAMPENAGDFVVMCDDTNAWSRDEDDLDSLRFTAEERAALEKAGLWSSELERVNED